MNAVVAWHCMLSHLSVLHCCCACRELSRTHSVCLFLDPSKQTAEVMQMQAAGFGISQLFFITEDLSSLSKASHEASAGGSAAAGSGSADSTTAAAAQRPYVLGHIVEYQDEAAVHFLDICNHCTVLNPSILSLGEQE